MTPNGWDELKSKFDQGMASIGESDPVGEVTNATSQVVAVLAEVAGKALDELGVDEEELRAELDTDEKSRALLDFVNKVSSLKARGAELDRLYKEAQEKVIGQPFQVASRGENMRLVADLYVAMLVASEALRQVFRALKALIGLFPELEELNPNFRPWVSSV